MKKFLYFTAAIGIFSWYGCQNHGVPANPNSTHFGSEFSDSTGFSAADALSRVDSLKGDVTISGKVSNVCQTEGCWFNLSLDSNRLLFVDFNHQFTVPRNIAGKDVLVHGRFYQDTLSVEQQKHLAADAGKSKAETDLIQTPKVELNFRAFGVKMISKTQP